MTILTTNHYQKVVLVGGANANYREEETSSADGTSCGEEVVEGDLLTFKATAS